MGNITKLFSWLKYGLIILGFSQNLFAQDAHLSQFYNASLFYNPATTGQQIENIRISYHHRQQWASVTNPYITNSFSLDKAIKGWGIGFTWINNHAGETSVHNNNILGSMAYKINVDAFSSITAGVQFGVYQRSINNSQLTFNNQYIPNIGFDPLQPNNENLITERVSSTDVNLGLLWHTKRDKIDFNLGIALSHLNKPNISLFQDNEDELEQKIVFNGSLAYKIKRDLHLIPTVLWGMHGHAQQINLGLIGQYLVNDSISVQGGLTSRLDDAIILYSGLAYKKFFLGLNYDVNYSSLRPASNGRGAFEFNLQIQLGKQPKKSKEKKLSSVKNPDQDNDGIPDISDKCPTVYGYQEYAGCPLQDTDKDGITDDKDLCPLVYGVVEKQGCPIGNDKDMDNDGVPDEIDQCPTVYGLQSLAGCPAQQDYDKDGIIDKIDKCPYIYGVEKYHGCPFRDSDNDGITDDVDQCPNVAGTASLNGCPFKDSDNDGMTDDIDQCPNEPGDIRNMGCPIGDMDKDGIADHIDRCPKQAGSLKNNGCPEGYINTKSNNHIYSGGHDIDLDNLHKIVDVIVYFDVDKSFIKSKYRKLLDEAAIALSKSSENTILINGHTDHDGSDEYNFKLGERRATEVRNYLIQNGVPYNRMLTLSHGELLPADSNNHHTGKAKNRRVEVVVIKNE